MTRIRGRSCSLATYRGRRQRVARALRQAGQAGVPVLVLGAPEHDPVLDHTPPAGRGRQDPWFDWLCGCHEPDAALLIETTPRRDTLFLDPGKAERVVWDGPRLVPGPEARRAFGVHRVRPIDDLRGAVETAAAAAGHRLALLWRKREPGLQSRAARSWRRRLRGIEAVDAEPLVTPLRMVKDAEEIAWHQRAVTRTAAGLADLLPRLPAMGHEAEVAASLVAAYCRHDYEPLAFAPIVGSAVNGATLHYKHNDQPLVPGAPVLIDSGARAGGYCADVTRTLPQHGRFDQPRLREVYDLVLRANALGRRHARPGITLEELNQIAWQPIIEAGFQRHHGLSHHIGLDVHDPADYALPLEAGMIISNEPGVYLPAEGFGIRIEDDLLITASGCRELTRAIPKQPADLEAAMRSSP